MLDETVTPQIVFGIMEEVFHDDVGCDPITTEI